MTVGVNYKFICWKNITNQFSQKVQTNFLTGEKNLRSSVKAKLNARQVSVLRFIKH
jgi:hypothetical protein